MIDAGSLRALAFELHEQQLHGGIPGDVFLFLNTDADSFLWEPMAAPMDRLPCFGGIGGYIDEVADLDFVVFDTPGGYLKSHAPVGEITFGQDVADGNLSGYMSWSEKPFNRLIWTRLERARAAARLAPRDSASPSFETRVRLLSTTHFGLASPVMNITRERKALALSETMLRQEQAALPASAELRLRDPAKSGLAAVQLSLEDGFCEELSRLRLESEGLQSWTACETGRHAGGCVASLYLIARFETPREEYALRFSLGESKKPALLTESGWSVTDAPTGLSLRFRGRELAALNSWIDYGGEICRFTVL